MNRTKITNVSSTVPLMSQSFRKVMKTGPLDIADTDFITEKSPC